MFCLRESHIWSDLICGHRLQMLWTNIFESCLCKGVLDLSPLKVQLEIEQQRLVKANLLGMMAFVSDWKKWTVCWR